MNTATLIEKYARSRWIAAMRQAPKFTFTYREWAMGSLVGYAHSGSLGVDGDAAALSVHFSAFRKLDGTEWVLSSVNFVGVESDWANADYLASWGQPYKGREFADAKALLDFIHRLYRQARAVLFYYDAAGHLPSSVLDQFGLGKQDCIERGGAPSIARFYMRDLRYDVPFAALGDAMRQMNDDEMLSLGGYDEWLASQVSY